MFRLVLLIAAIFAVHAKAQPLCPEGSRGVLDHTQIMMNFGRYLMPAGKLMRYLSAPADITDAQIIEALDGIDIVIACSELLSTADCSASVLPNKVNSMSAAENRAYREAYARHMVKFIEALQTYKKILLSQLNTPPKKRDFDALAKQERHLRDLAGEAHGAL